MKIGFIGLGNLGTPIAANILESGHTLHIFNRTVSKTKQLAGKGAIVSESIAALAREVDIVFTMVSDDAALVEIVNGENGLAVHMKPESIHVSMSTILPATAEMLSIQHKEQNQYYLAAPVFGRPEAAEAKKLNVAISGDKKIRARIEPLLKNAGAAGVWNFGDAITAANTVKLCGNFLIASAIESIGESVKLATASGVNPQDMWNMFLQTIFNAPAYHIYSNIILNKRYEPAAFSARLGLKDLDLVLQQAAVSTQEMPLAVLLRSHMHQLVSSGKGETDWSAISTAVDKNPQL
jgi:3-hydroxyisobutyrate dehydrogenase-like beta-hydroxyacid dehydrogenase